MQNGKKEGTLLDCIVTMTDWIVKQTVDFTQKNIITNFLNQILIILIYKKLQSHFVEKEYLGNKHSHGWDALCTGRKCSFSKRRWHLINCANYF